MAADTRASAPSLWLFNSRPSYVHEATAPAEPASTDAPSTRPSSSEKEPYRTNSGAARSADPPRLSDVSAPGSAVHPTASYDTDLEAMVQDTGAGGGGGGYSNCPWPWQRSRRKHGGWTSRQARRHQQHSSCRGFGVTAEVWPGQRHWKMKAKEQKMQRSCTGLSRLSKRKRMAVKILIGLLVVGVAVGVGLGISKALGAPMWSPHDYRNTS